MTGENCKMCKNPKITIVDDEKTVRETLAKTIEKIGLEEGIAFEIDSLSAPPKDLSELDSTSIIFMDEKLGGGVSGEDVCYKLGQRRGEKLVRVMMSGGRTVRDKLEAQNKDICDYYFSKGGELTKALQGGFIGRQRDRGLLERKVSVGIVGLGILGQNTLAELKDSSHVSEVYVYSGELMKKGRDSEVFSLMGIPGNDSKVHALSSEDELVERKPDVIIVSTGKHNFRYPAKTTRYKITQRLLNATLAKTDGVMSAIERNSWPGLLIVASNPVGHVLTAFEHLYDLENTLVTGFSALDSRRVRKFLANELNNHETRQAKRNGSYHPLPIIGDPEDIFIPVFGDHGKEWADFDAATLYGENISEARPRMNMRDFRRTVLGLSRSQGIRTVSAASSLKSEYKEGAHKDLARMVGCYSHFIRFPKDGWFVPFDLINNDQKTSSRGHLGWPIELRYDEPAIFAKPGFDYDHAKAVVDATIRKRKKRDGEQSIADQIYTQISDVQKNPLYQKLMREKGRLNK